MIDILVGLQHGDEGKGKVAKCFIDEKKYDLCVRFNGGPNAGHTIIDDNGQKVILHQLPCGIIKKIPCLISNGCVLDLTKLALELKQLEDLGYQNLEKFLYIAKTTHIIQSKHIQIDKDNNKIGTTGSGIGPAYSDKYRREGKRIGEIVSSLKPRLQIVDHIPFMKKFNNILFEGAQGFELDIDYGDYPFVTSSNCISAYAYINGAKPYEIRDIIGVCKLYDTYIGNKPFEPEENSVEFDKLRKLGNEYGSTTDRSRQCNWLNLDRLCKAIEVNDVNIIIINKCDIVKEFGIFKIIDDESELKFIKMERMLGYIETKIKERCSRVKKILFSYSPKKI